jgi:hypothetical protein
MKSSLLAGSLLLLSACSGRSYFVDFPHQDLPLPGTLELERRVAAFRSGEERWHGDPKRVAHMALLNHVDVPWRGDAFRDSKYGYHGNNPDHPEWGSYVVRGWTDRAGRTHRCRVKVRSYEGVWYPVQVSRYMSVDYVEMRDLPGGEPPDVGH